MANIELVINMDEYTYNDLKKGKIYSSVRDVPQESVLAIANGTPLPKGQGRLIERLLNAAETLKQEPKVGHWVEKEYHFENCWAECSICEKTASGTSTDTGWGFEYSFSDYCPNCGAKMIDSDEEGEEGEI